MLRKITFVQMSGLMSFACILSPNGDIRCAWAASSVPEEVPIAIAKLRSDDSGTRREAVEAIVGQPCVEIGPAIVEALKEDPAFRREIVRKAAFEVLSSCTEEKGQIVEATLLTGLNDGNASVAASSARGLATARRDTKVAAARLLAERWDYWVKPNDDPPQWIVDALVHVDGVGEMLDKFASGEGPSRKTALWTLGMLGWKTKGTFDGKSEHQEFIRRFVVESLESSSPKVREAAFESLMSVFSKDIVVFDSCTEYRLNPQMEQALEKMKATDPDESLRSQAAKFLEQLHGQLDHLAQRILRERQSDRKEE